MGDMQYRNVGDSGLRVSVVGLGCNNFGRWIDEAASADVVSAALDHGITFFDTAEVYGLEPGASESILGKALQGRRDQAVLATKFGMRPIGDDSPRHGSRSYIVNALEASLQRLGTDYVDLYQMHAPDPTTPIEETLAALDDLVAAGKVRYVGCSNFSSWGLGDADWTARRDGHVRFVAAQNRYNLLERGIEVELVPACERYGVGVLPYFPLASGMLTGKFTRGEAAPETSRIGKLQLLADMFLTDANFDIVEGLERFGAERGLTLLDVAFGGLAAQSTVSSVIAGATSPAQVTANAAAGSWVPTAADLQELDTIAPTMRGRPLF